VVASYGLPATGSSEAMKLRKKYSTVDFFPTAGTVWAYETHISAEKEKAIKNTRISQAIRHDQRPSGLVAPAQKGQSEAFGVGFLQMPRKNSLSHADFVRIDMAKFRRERGSYFILSFGILYGQKTLGIKASCVVSKKTAPRAVDRNLIKRRWREAMRECLPFLSAPATLIFYAMRPANNASYKDIKKDVAALVSLSRAKLRAS